MRQLSKLLLVGAIALGSTFATVPALAQDAKLLNVSYDPTRELYEEINSLFAEHYKAKTGKSVTIAQSHGGSGKQARSVIDGLKADVVTLALGGDIAAVEKSGLIQPGWEKEFPQNSAPYTSTVVFVVRKGNPKGIKDWNDLIKPGVDVIIPNPKTSGGARWYFLAGWAQAAGAKGYDLSTAEGQKLAAENAAKAKEFPVTSDPKGLAYVTALYKNVPVLDTGARGSTVTFAQKGIGDVLVNWENEAHLTLQEFGADKYEIVYPSVSILAEPQVAIVDKNVDDRGTRAVAQAYIEFLYTPEAQDTIGALHYRPRDLAALDKHKAQLPPIPLFTIDEVFGGWSKAQGHFFGDGGVFDQLYKPAASAK